MAHSRYTLSHSRHKTVAQSLYAVTQSLYAVTQLKAVTQSLYAVTRCQDPVCSRTFLTEIEQEKNELTIFLPVLNCSCCNDQTLDFTQ